MKKRVAISIISLCIVCWFASDGQAGSIEISPLEVIGNVTVSGEYDDNVYLENDTTENPDDDFIIHIMPSLTVIYPYKEHKASLNFFGDYRRGTSEDLSDFNYGIEGIMDFNFSGGMNVKLHDTYTQTRFDRELEGDPGINKSRSNHAGVDIAYPFGNRLRAETGYTRGWEEYEEDGSEDRDIDTDDFYAKLAFPITWSTEGFVAYDYYKQSSDEIAYRDYDKHHYRAGAKWEGPYRFWLGGEVGYETIDYDAPEEEDYDGFTWRVGAGAKITEKTDTEAWVGMDGYENFIYGAKLNYQYSDATAFNLSGSKETRNIYSSAFKEPVYEATRVSIGYTTNFIEKFYLNLLGSYEFQDSFSDDREEQEYDTWIARSDLSYFWRDYLKFGIYYQYAKRDATDEAYDYENNRVGIYASGTFKN